MKRRSFLGALIGAPLLSTCAPTLAPAVTKVTEDTGMRLDAANIGTIEAGSLNSCDQKFRMTMDPVEGLKVVIHD